MGYKILLPLFVPIVLSVPSHALRIMSASTMTVTEPRVIDGHIFIPVPESNNSPIEFKTYTLTTVRETQPKSVKQTSMVLDSNKKPIDLRSLSYSPSPQGGLADRRLREFTLPSGGMSQFLNTHGAAVSSALVGLMSLPQFNSAIRNEVNKLSDQLGAAFQSGRAVDGNYVRAVEALLSSGQSVQDYLLRSSRHQLTAWSASELSPLDRDRIQKLNEYQRAMLNPLSLRQYSLDEDARREWANELDKQIHQRSYFKAAEAFEGLAYDQGLRRPAEEISPVASEDGILRFEMAQPDVPASPLAGIRMQTRMYSAEGQLSRRIANRYQAFWAESKGLDALSAEQIIQYQVGLSLLHSGDSSLAGGRPAGLAQLGAANAALEFAMGLGDGLSAGLHDLKEGLAALPEVAHAFAEYSKAVKENPALIIDTSVKLWRSLPAVKDALITAAWETADTLATGDPRKIGQLSGRVGFELLTAVGTGGTGAPARFSLKAASEGALALKATQAVLKGSAYVEKMVGEPVVQAARLAAKAEPEFRNAVLKTALLEPGKAADAISIYRRATTSSDLLARGGNVYQEASEIGLAALESQSKGARDFIKAGLASRGPGVKLGADYLGDADQVKNTLGFYEQVEKGLAHVKGTEIKGFVARISESGMDIHPGVKPSANRYGLGGPEGQTTLSFGYGKTADEAIAVAKAEVGELKSRVYVSTIDHTGILDLTDPTVLRSIGVDAESLVLKNDLPGAYMKPNVVSSVAERQGFAGVLAKSAPARTKANLHLFNGGNW